jgi:hypothetical protein
VSGFNPYCTVNKLKILQLLNTGKHLIITHYNKYSLLLFCWYIFSIPLNHSCYCQLSAAFKIEGKNRLTGVFLPVKQQQQVAQLLLL